MVEVKRCIHCGDELETTKEKKDNVCASCSTALTDDNYFEQMMDKAIIEMEVDQKECQ